MNNLPATNVINMSMTYLQEMKGMFHNYIISNENDFAQSLLDIVNLYAENTFAGNPNTIQSFLFFQDLEFVMHTVTNHLGNNHMTPISLVYESLIMLLQTYTYEMYLSDQGLFNDNNINIIYNHNHYIN